jgi:hypothetical protein
MEKKVCPHTAVSLDETAHRFRMQHILLPNECGRDQRLDVQFVRVQEQANEGHLIVGLIADIADDDHPWMAGEGINVR